MKDNLQSLIDTFFCSVDIDKFYSQNQKEKLADWLREYGVFAPPCNVGDTVYVIFSQFKSDINKCRVDEFLIREREIFAVLDVHYPNYIVRRKTSIQISWFNRFAFTTQEAAEQALKEGVWNEHNECLYRRHIKGYGR